MTPLNNVVLYTRKDCHLCEDACLTLRKYGLQPQLIDIDTDPGLVRLYDVVIPVVVIDGIERFRGQVNEVLLKRLISANS